MDIIMVSLIIENNLTHEQKKVQMKNSDGKIQEEVSLPVLDYMLSLHKDVDSFLKRALEERWITSEDFCVKIVDTKGNEYALPFEHNDLIYKCSEAAIYRGGQRFIIKSEKNRSVDDSEFHDFLNEFLSNVLDDEGYYLVEHGYFSEAVPFQNLLKRYYDLKTDEDHIYNNANASRLEKGFASCRMPVTIDDYLRDYSIFRLAVKFNDECKKRRNEKKVSKAKATQLKGQDLKPRIEKHKATYYQGKRSLCYVIGNGCEPLILKTDTPDALDQYVVDNFDTAREVRRAYKDEISNYILEHKEYVQQIRDLIQNNSYSGQVTILSHTDDGGFSRLPNGAYFRYPVVYSATFKKIKNLYCNIDRLKKQYQKLEKEYNTKDTAIAAEKAQALYSNLEENITDVLNKLETEKRVSKEELEAVMGEIKKIITDMQDLEEADYHESLEQTKYVRMFSPSISKEVRFVKAEAVPRSYKIKLDEWAKQIADSPYRYDHVRFIMRHLRKKNDVRLEVGKEIPLNDIPNPFQIQTIDQKIVEVEETEEVDEREEFFHPSELEQLYPDNESEPFNFKEGNIHVHKSL